MPQRSYENSQPIDTYTWQECKDLIDRVARDIKNSGFSPNQGFCIARGSVIFGYGLAIKLDIPMAILAAESYRAKDPSATIESPSAEITFSREIAITQQFIGNRALLLDDLTERGLTLDLGKDFIQCRYPNEPDETNRIEKIRTATIWHKNLCQAPDFFAKSVQPDEQTGLLPYIVQPHELFGPHDLERTIEICPILPNADIFRTWEPYTNDIVKMVQLAIQLTHKKGIKINQIIALTSGGVIPGILATRILDAYYAILAAKDLSSLGIPDHVPFARDLVKTSRVLGNHVLVVDDRTWTPTTLQHSLKWLNKQYGWAIKSLHTAVIYQGPNGFPVDIAVHKVQPLANGKMPNLTQPMKSEFQPL